MDVEYFQMPFNGRRKFELLLKVLRMFFNSTLHPRGLRISQPPTPSPYPVSRRPTRFPLRMALQGPRTPWFPMIPVRFPVPMGPEPWVSRGFPVSMALGSLGFLGLRQWLRHQRHLDMAWPSHGQVVVRPDQATSFGKR